jgi:hypothetical protein
MRQNYYKIKKSTQKFGCVAESYYLCSVKTLTFNSQSTMATLKEIKAIFDQARKESPNDLAGWLEKHHPKLFAQIKNLKTPIGL